MTAASYRKSVHANSVTRSIKQERRWWETVRNGKKPDIQLVNRGVDSANGKSIFKLKWQFSWWSRVCSKFPWKVIAQVAWPAEYLQCHLHSIELPVRFIVWPNAILPPWFARNNDSHRTMWPKKILNINLILFLQSSSGLKCCQKLESCKRNIPARPMGSRMQEVKRDKIKNLFFGNLWAN